MASAGAPAASAAPNTSANRRRRERSVTAASDGDTWLVSNSGPMPPPCHSSPRTWCWWGRWGSWGCWCHCDVRTLMHHHFRDAKRSTISKKLPQNGAGSSVPAERGMRSSMQSRKSVEESLRQWLKGHHAVISRSEARRLGASDSLIRSKLDRGEWVRIHQGIYRLAAAPRPTARICGLRASLRTVVRLFHTPPPLGCGACSVTHQ